MTDQTPTLAQRLRSYFEPDDTEEDHEAIRALMLEAADALDEDQAATRRSSFARDLGAAAKLVRDVAAGMLEYEAEHSEQMFDDLFELAARLERGRDLMVTNDEWSWG